MNDPNTSTGTSTRAAPSLEPTAWAWVEHVRRGGGTPWMSWVDSYPAAPETTTAGGPLPGAAQLEFVRRLGARHSGPTVVDFARLADVVLARSGHGRGLPQLPLLWPSSAHITQVGAPPTDPALVPADELIRVGVGALADLLQHTPPRRDRSPRKPRRKPRRKPWSRQFRLAGAPTTVASVRASLAAAGHAEGGPSPDVLLFVPRFDALLAQVWSARVQRGVPIRWATFTGKWAARQEVPPAADITAVAAHWRDRVGPEHVHVIAFEADEDARRTAAEVLGLRTREPVAPTLDTLDSAGLDVVRRVNRLLNVRLPPAEHRTVVRRLTPLLAPAASKGPQPQLCVSEPHVDWALGSAWRISSGLRDHGYAVHGDLEGILSTLSDARSGATTHPRRRDVLNLVLDACARAAALS